MCSMRLTKIEFVCRGNVARSTMAQSLFNHYNQNQNIICNSSGVDDTYLGDYVHPLTSYVLEREGIEVEPHYARLYREALNYKPDKVFVMDDYTLRRASEVQNEIGYQPNELSLLGNYSVNKRDSGLQISIKDPTGDTLEEFISLYQIIGLSVRNLLLTL